MDMEIEYPALTENVSIVTELVERFDEQPDTTDEYKYYIIEELIRDLSKRFMARFPDTLTPIRMKRIAMAAHSSTIPLLAEGATAFEEVINCDTDMLTVYQKIRRCIITMKHGKWADADLATDADWPEWIESL